jgi:hypothetical protein
MAGERPKGPTPLVLTADQVGEWRARLEAGREVAKTNVTVGKREVERYQAKTLKSAPNQHLQHTVVVPLDYASVEQKKAQLFKVPEIIAEGKRPDCEAAAPLMSAVTNHALSAEGVNAPSMLFEVQPDVLLQGYAVTKIGYENVVDGTRDVPTGQQIEDPNFQQPPGAILGLQTAPLIPEVIQTPNIISETYYWRRISPGFLLAPAEFRGSNFDDAAWIAWRFCDDVPEGESYTGGDADDELLLSTPPEGSARSPKRWGTEVWCKASVYDPAVKHPEIIRTFKLYDDATDGVELKDSPFQRWVVPPPPAPPPMPGQPPMPPQPAPLSPTYVAGAELIGMKGFPIHVLTLRYLSDTAFPPSDSEMGAGTSQEISIGRTQLLQRRDRSLPQTLYDATRVTDPAILAKLERNDNSGFIGVPGNPAEMFLPLNKGQFGRENFAFNDQAQQDYDRTWALGANSGTLKSDSAETATKSKEVRGNIDTRLEAERERERDWFLAGVTKLMSLYQIFADKDDYVRILGPDGTARFETWNRTLIPGPFAFTSRPNSHVRLDAETDFRQELDFFNLAGNAPEGNRFQMLRRLAVKRGMDPQLVLQQPPPKTPEPAKGSISFKIEDFFGPGAPVAAELAKQCGFTVSPQALQAASMFGQLYAQMQAEQAALEGGPAGGEGGPPQTEHGGSMEGGGPERINKHTAAKTGGTQGIGV